MRTRNLTPFPFGPKVTSRRPPQPEMALVVRGAFALVHGEPLAALDGMDQGALTAEVLAEDDERRGECFYPGDFADFKLNAEVMLSGSAFAPGGKPVGELPVRFAVGAWSKSLRVVGRRVWVDRVLGSSASAPEPFVAMPLAWANAFGGPGHAENPAGKGHKTPEVHNLEYPDEPAGSRSDRPRPASFGPINPAWPQRARKVGKDYGKAWRAERAPFYAKDFDWTIFQAAPPDQQLEGYLRGDEELLFQNLHPDVPVLTSRLPSLRVRAFVKGKDGRFREVPMNLDTLFADLDADRVFLTWRGLDAVKEDDLADVAATLIASEPLGAEPLPQDHYRALLDAFEADPSGVKAAMPPGALELADRLEREREEGLPADAPGEGSLDRLDAMMTAMGSPGLRAAPGTDLRARMAEQMRADPAPPLMSRRPGSLPPVRIGPQMRALRAQLDRLKQAAGDHPHPQLAELEARLRDPRLQELDPTYRPDRPDAPPEEPGPGRDLSGQDLSGRDLSGKDLRGVNLEGAILTRANLRGADLRGANLKHAVLYKADLGGARLANADLTMAQLGRARAAEADFTGAILEQAWFERADLRAAVLAGATGEYVQLAKADLTGAKAEACRLTVSRFTEATLERADFSRADLSRGSFGEARARGVDLRGARLINASFEAADLCDARLSDARGDGAAWMRAKLDGADLQRAWLPDTYFIEASASRADFTEANLRGANLYRVVAEHALFAQANLFCADLRKATLSGARFTGANLYDAKLVGAAGKGCDFNGANLKASTLEEQG